MIIKGLFELIFGLLKIVFSPINLPALPESIQNYVDEFVNIMIGSFGMLLWFVDLEVLSFLIPVVLIIVNFERVWDMIMFILRKIPFLGIE